MTTPKLPDVILVVDDDIAMCELTTTILQREGYHTRYCTSGLEALGIIQHDAIALLLLDVMMPDMDGFEVCSRLRKTDKGKTLPVILLTGRDDIDTRLEGMQSGVTEFLAKPVTRHELIARVRGQLHIIELTRQLQIVEDTLQKRTAPIAQADR